MKGFTLIELTIGLVITAVLVLGSAKAYRDFSKTSTAMLNGSIAELELSSALLEIQKHGKAARTCAVVSNPSAAENMLVCSVNFGRPPTPVDTNIRFLRVGQRLIYQREVGLNWENVRIYDHVVGFDVCGEAEWSAAGNCPIEPASFNAVAKSGSAEARSRFFRIRIRSEVAMASDAARPTTYQTAFFVRTVTPPAAQVPVLGAFFQW